MADEEKVDNTSAGVPANKTSDVPTGIPAEVPASTAASAPASTAKAPAEGAPFICDVCGKPFDTKPALSGHMSIHSKKPETTDEDLPDEFLDEREILDRIIAEATPTRKRKSIVRLASRYLGNKKESIEALAEALRLADVQPHLRNLILKNWASHMDIPDIEDMNILDIEKKEEKTKPGEKKTEEDIEKEKKKTPRNLEETLEKVKNRRLNRLDSLQIQKEIADMEREMGVGKEEDDGEEKHTMIVDGMSLQVTAKEMLAWKRYLMEQKREDEEREERKEERKQQVAERQRRIDERRPQNDGGLVEWVVGEGNNAKTVKVRPETIPLLIQAQGVKNNPQESQSKEDIQQMIEQNIESRTKKLTSEDVERIVQHAVGDLRSVTKEELVYKEAHDKYLLEEKKLDESGKTRDVVGKAISDGFGHAGKIISRMMTEEGSDTGTPVKGYTDQVGNMMQVACPGCNAVITAPVGSPWVVCPGCNKRWEVERPPQKTEEKKPPADEFTPEQKKVIEKSLEDARKGRIKPLETSDAPAIIPEPTSDAPEIIPKQLTDAIDTSEDAHEPTSATDTTIVPKDVEKIAEGSAIGEGVKKVEEELKKKKDDLALRQHEEKLKKVEEDLKKKKDDLEALRQRHEEENERKRKSALEKVEETIKESPVEKKPWPKIDSNICPICSKKCKGKRGVSVHITVAHPEYKK